MKANFKIKKNHENNIPDNDKQVEDITEKEFEEYVSKAGASGTFMVFRSINQDDELGIDEL